MRLLVIGGGPAGMAAALQAPELGADVTLLESRSVGGTSLHSGPAPVCTLARAARLVRDARSWQQFGLRGAQPEIDIGTLSWRVLIYGPLQARPTKPIRSNLQRGRRNEQTRVDEGHPQTSRRVRRIRAFLSAMVVLSLSSVFGLPGTTGARGGGAYRYCRTAPMSLSSLKRHTACSTTSSTGWRAPYRPCRWAARRRVRDAGAVCATAVQTGVPSRHSPPRALALRTPHE